MPNWAPQRMKRAYGGAILEAVASVRRSDTVWCCVPVHSMTAEPGGTTDCRTLRGSTESTISQHTAPAAATRKERAMDVLYPRCCGVDVHKKQVVACLLTPGPAGGPREGARPLCPTSAEVVRLVWGAEDAEGSPLAHE